MFSVAWGWGLMGRKVSMAFSVGQGRQQQQDNSSKNTRLTLHHLIPQVWILRGSRIHTGALLGFFARLWQLR